MRIAYSWLKEFLPEAPSPERLEELLAGLGLETETIEHLAAPHPKIVFAKVLSAEPIEGTNLRKLIVDAGQEFQLVSGAPNAKAGVGIALALPGAVLPDGLELSARKIQGYESFGMGLSPRELGVGDYAGGLMEFPAEGLPPGTSLAAIWPDETVIEVEITPNRPDWLSVYGVARDLAALGMALVEPNPQPTTSNLALPYRIWIEDTAGCDRFTLSYARGLKVAPSPLLIQRRLYAAGMRPISNIVDATNYAMLELGNPMHAYDLRDIGEGLLVRRAKAGEQLTTLDGQERKLEPKDLLITVKKGDQTIPDSLAGVMGGANSEVHEDTTEVALEVAHFDPVTVRRSAKRHGLKTEASYRFERGVDPDGQVRAALRFMELIQAWSNGVEVAHERLDLNHTAPPKPIAFRTAYTNRLIGAEFPVEEQLGVLKRLGCGVAGTADPYTVTPPTYRSDLTIEEDLVEEVTRIIGYDKIPVRLPSFFPASDNVGVDAEFDSRETLKQTFAGLGFQEVLNYSWSSEEECAQFRAPKPTVFMQNPQTPERTTLRTALYPGLLRNLKMALDQSETGPFVLFEIGNVFGTTEQTHLAAMLSGQSVPGGWQAGLEGGYFALKGLLETAAHNLGSTVRVEKDTQPHLHPGIAGTVYWNDQKVGHVGALHPAIAAALELPQTYLLELTLPLPKGAGGFRDVPKVPASLRDIAVVVSEKTSYAEVEGLIRSSAGDLLESLEVFDVYRGKPLADNEKSMAFHLSFRNPERTLTDVETDGFMQQVIGAVEKAGYSIRK